MYKLILMSNSEINDIRIQKDFRSCSFSEFKRTDVTKELLNSIYQGKIEPSCYWTAELICAGHYIDIWNVIILYFSKYIHLGNPKIINYIDMRINSFKEIVRNGFIDNELRMRNNPKVRRLFGEIMIILCQSTKKHQFETIKIKKEEFDIAQLSERFKAPNTKYADEVFKKDDPKQLFIAINELSYHLSKESYNNIECCFWVEWILQYESQCKQKRIPCKAERRSMIPVKEKEQMDIIWLIWELLIIKANKKGSLYRKSIDCLLNIYCLKYTSGVIRKRRYIIYYAIAIITENVNYNIQLIKDTKIIEKILSKMDNIYKQIKKNEHAPDTDYLFNNTSSNNIENTIKKLDIMNNIFDI